MKVRAIRKTKPRPRLFTMSYSVFDSNATDIFTGQLGAWKRVKRRFWSQGGPLAGRRYKVLNLRMQGL
jgi:hypothetical protein